MKTVPLKTSSSKINLIQPNVDRDAALGVKWLKGQDGHDTLLLMGVPDSDIKPPTLKDERARVQGFIAGADRLNWMIAFEDQVVGAIWVDLEPTEYLPAPAIHIMIGDPAARGKGIGSVSINAVIDYLKKSGIKHLYSRRLVENRGSSRLLRGVGFSDLGEVYTDTNGLDWQNVSYAIKA